jgi:small subunit ribosomal protein S6
MKNRYEALIVLNAQGREDTVKDIVDRLESEFQKEGAQIEQVQKMDKRPFSYASGALDSGYYVNFVFEADPQLITKLRTKFKLDPEVYRQHYQRLGEKTERKQREGGSDDAAKKVARSR